MLRILLSSSEKNYVQLEREALSLVYDVKKFHQFLYGRLFTLYTDHKPLTVIFNPRKGIPPLSATRLQRWSVIMSAYDYTIVLKPTQLHRNVDGLSRLPLFINRETKELSEPSIFNVRQIENLPVTAIQLRAATRQDPILAKVLLYIKHGWPTEVPEHLKPYWTRRTEITVEDDCLMWGIHVIVPKKLQNAVLQELHQTHLGIVRMKKVARSYVWWTNIDKDIEHLVKNCCHCQVVQNVPPVVPLHPWIWPSEPWRQIHADFAGPFCGRTFLVVLDSYSRWPEIIQMKTTTTTATILQLRKLFLAYGLSKQLVSDNGPQFSSSELAEFLQKNGLKHIKSAPYHPLSNGAVKQFIQTFKKAMRSGEHQGPPFDQYLNMFLLTYRSTAHYTTNMLPCMLFLKREVRTRLDLLRPDVKSRVTWKQAGQKKAHDEHCRERTLFIGQRVMAKNYRAGPGWLSDTVIERNGPLLYLIKVSGGQLWRRHIDQLREVDNTPSQRRLDAIEAPLKIFCLYL